jgi:hypothetical protein
MSTPTAFPPPPRHVRPVDPGTVGPRGPVDPETIGPRGPGGPGGPSLRIVPWVDEVADPHGVHPCSRYVELYWLGIIGPSTTWLLRRLHYGLEVHGTGFDLNLPDTARALGLGDKMGKNSPFRRALARLITFELARPHGPGELAVRTSIPPLPLRHLNRLPDSLQRSHRRWLSEQRLTESEQMRRRALRLATGLAEAGHDRPSIERRLAGWQFHPAVAFHAACVATGEHDVPRVGDGRGSSPHNGPGNRTSIRPDDATGAATGTAAADTRTAAAADTRAVTAPGSVAPSTRVVAAKASSDPVPVARLVPMHPALAGRRVGSCAPDLPDEGR